MHASTFPPAEALLVPAALYNVHNHPLHLPGGVDCAAHSVYSTVCGKVHSKDGDAYLRAKLSAQLGGAPAAQTEGIA